MYKNIWEKNIIGPQDSQSPFMDYFGNLATYGSIRVINLSDLSLFNHPGNDDYGAAVLPDVMRYCK
jgi:hypothetical protein